MHIDTIPTYRIKVEAMEHSIFTGTKYCFVNFNNNTDWSWDGEEEIVEWDKKGESVLFSKKELDTFRHSDTVHGFLIKLRKERKEEIETLKKKIRTAKTHWEHSRISGHTCNPKQMLKNRIEFLENNEICFVEVKFEKKKI